MYILALLDKLYYKPVNISTLSTGYIMINVIFYIHHEDVFFFQLNEIGLVFSITFRLHYT